MVGKRICDCSMFWDKANVTLHNFRGFLTKLNPVPPYYNWCSNNVFQCFSISAMVIYFAGAFICLGIKSYIIHREKKLRQQRSELSSRMWRLRRQTGRGCSPSHSLSDDGSLDRMIPMPVVTVNRPSLLQRLQYGRPVIRLEGYVIDDGTVIQNAAFNYNPSIVNAMDSSSAQEIESPCLTDVDEPPNYSEIIRMSRPPSFSPPPPYDECVINTTL